MEILSIEFLSALASIVVIDLVLAGDNAIVIALAARSVPRHLQRRAIVAGTAGAVIVRSSMTLLVVWLLKIPGLLLIGGALLVFIAYRLLRPETEKRRRRGEPAAREGFWGAMRTIVVADAIMGLDNVLGVAGAAHGSFLLVVLGLLISVPIVDLGQHARAASRRAASVDRLSRRRRARVDRGHDDDERAAARRCAGGLQARRAAAVRRDHLRCTVVGLRRQSPPARIADQRAGDEVRRAGGERGGGRGRFLRRA